MSIYSPKNIQEAMELSNVFSNCGRFNAQEILMMHACFGHHYGGNMGLTMTQAYSLKGKPALNADAMAGIVRKSGLCRFIKITEWTTELCTMAMARHDEDFEHVYTFTVEMAKAQGLLKNQNWRSMPKQMLRARCLTMGLRATFPEAVSGIYSADEMADNMEMNDDERLEVVAESLGEEVKKNSNLKHEMVKELQKQPKPQPSPDHKTVTVKSEPTTNPANRDFTNYQGWADFVQAFGEDLTVTQSSLEFKGLQASTMTEPQIYLHCVGPLASRGFGIFESRDVDTLKNEDVQPLADAFAEFFDQCAIEVFEGDYVEALKTYIDHQSKPWRVELIKLFNDHYEALGEEAEEIKKYIMVANHWGEYGSISRHIEGIING